MRKILLSLVAVLLTLTGLTARGQSGTGQLSATGQVWSNGWQPQTVENAQVSVTYNTNFGSISIMNLNTALHSSYVSTMTLTIDRETGNVYREKCNAYGDNNPYPAYYADQSESPSSASASVRITGQLKNTGENEATLTLSPWGDLTYSSSQDTWFFNNGKWDTTEVVIPFTIPILPAYEEPKTEPEPVEKTGDGTWSATLASWDYGDLPISDQIVKGKFSGNQLVVDKILTNDAVNTAGHEYFEPLTLTVNLETGEVRGENQLAFVYTGYTNYNGMYCDNDKINNGKPWVITGKFVNTGDGKSKLTLSEWCTKYDGTAGRGGPGVWKDSQAIFEFEVEGLLTEETQEPEPEPVEKTGDGTWSATLASWDYGDLPISDQIVKGKFSGNQLVVDKILTNDAVNTAGHEYFEPLTLTVNLETGEVRGENQLAFVYTGYTNYNGMYCDNDKINNGKPWVITGKFVNTGDGKSKLTLSEWCTKYDGTAGRGGPGVWKDSQAIFEFEVEGLLTEETQEPEPEPTTNGKMTYTYNMWDADSFQSSHDVNGSYENKVLTITGLIPTEMKSETYPLNLTVDTETGDLVGLSQRAYLTSIQGLGDDLPVYYADQPKPRDKKITGKVENIEDGKCKVTLSDWCELVYYATDITQYGVVADGHFENTEIIFDFQIPDLASEEEPEPEPTTNGKMTYTYNMWEVDSFESSHNVNGNYENKVLTITGLIPFEMKSETNPLNLTVDTETGELVGLSQRAYTTSHKQYGDDLPVYYADQKPNPRDRKITGKVENIEDGKCKVTLSDWCELVYYATDISPIGVFAEGHFEDTEIIFDFQIPDLGATVDPEPEPEPGEIVSGTFIGQFDGNQHLVFSDDNPLGVKIGLKSYAKGSYGNYHKLTWSNNISYYYSTKNGQYYFVLPAKINPSTKEITVISDFNNLRSNHIKFDIAADSKQVYENLYESSSANEDGTEIENSCIVIASYYGAGLTNFNRVEKAYYLKGGEFKGDANGNIPEKITFEANKIYQWDLVLEEIPLGEAEESDYVAGKGTFKSLSTETGGKDELRTATVDGVFNKGQLKVDKMPTSIPDDRTYCKEIVFDVNLEEGTATATDQAVYDLLYQSSYVPAYFATYPEKSQTVTGDFVNLGNGKCQLTLPDWCELFRNTTVNGIYWAQTKIVFDFEVTGLKEGAEVNDPVVGYIPTINYMTANVGTAEGDSKLYENLTAEYNETDKTIKITNVAGKKEYPLTLTVDNEGKLVSSSKQMSDFQWDDTESLTFYYSDVTNEDCKVYGQVTNRTDGTCEITLEPWGDYAEEYGLFMTKWYNTFMLLDLSIPGLPNYTEGGTTDPEPGVQSGVIEGEWEFVVEDLYANTNRTEKWTATLRDGQLKFSGNDDCADFYATYYSDGTVTISNQETFVGVGGSRNYDIYQIAFNSYSMTDGSYSTSEEISAQFDASKGTMSFTTSPRQGILWRAYTNGEIAGGYDMFAFVKGTQISKVETEPSLELNADDITCNATEFFADVFVPVHTLGLPIDTEITLTYALDDAAPASKQVEAGNNMLSFMGLKPGTAYVLHLTAESGELKSEADYRFMTSVGAGIDSIDSDNDGVRYFNLQGLEIFNPTPGTICIKVTGNKAERIMVK